MKRLILFAALLTPACGSGVDWFPAAASQPATLAQTETTTSEAAGIYLSSYRNPNTREWYTDTSTGTFRNFTSAKFAAREPLTLRTTKKGDAVTRRMLFGQSEELEIKL